MTSAAPHELLRCARVRRGEDFAALSVRTGLRVQHIRAIEEGRFGDLPPGIYARASIRSFAAAYDLDPDAVLADCSALLPHIGDPIDALARARGVTRAPEPATPTPCRTVPVAGHRFRPFAAATVDAAVTGALVLAASFAAVWLARVSIADLESSAPALFLVGLIFGSLYYVWMGGLGGTTVGEYAVGPEPLQRDPRPLTVRAIALRTRAAATADARAIYLLGVWTGQRLTRAGAARTVPTPAPSPSLPPPPGRAEALTWSMNQRASVPPPPLRPRHG